MATFSPEEMNELKELIGLGFTAEQVVKLKTETVIVSGQEVVSGAVLASVSDADNESETVEVDEGKELTIATLVSQLLPLILEPRHLEIFEWLCRATQSGQSDVVRQMLRAAVIKEKPAWREAMGKGGGSSRNIETLAERLTPVKVKD